VREFLGNPVARHANPKPWSTIVVRFLLFIVHKQGKQNPEHDAYGTRESSR